MSPPGPAIVVVGAGAAGLMAAATVAELEPSIRTTIISDRAIGASNSVMAQGGLHVPHSTAGSRDSMIADMLAAGGDPTLRPRVVDYVDRIGPTIKVLERWGLELDRRAGAIVRRQAGGMSEPRIVGTSDSIGPSVLKVLKHRLANSGVQARPATLVSGVERTDQGIALTGDFGTLVADAAIVATGGIARRRAEVDGLATTNPPNRNHLLHHELATKLGEIDPDLFQFHPFGLVDLLDADSTGSTGHAVPETIVGYPEVELVDRVGRPIVDLRSGRLTITMAIRETVQAGLGVAARDGRTRGCLLTLSRIEPERLAQAFPSLARRLERAGLTGHDVVVEPFLHYQLGGLASETDGSTAMMGLFLAGEIRGGLHGRNRLMGNGLTEALVSGRAAAEASIRFVQRHKGAPS